MRVRGKDPEDKRGMVRNLGVCDGLGERKRGLQILAIHFGTKSAPLSSKRGEFKGYILTVNLS